MKEINTEPIRRELSIKPLLDIVEHYHSDELGRFEIIVNLSVTLSELYNISIIYQYETK